ncbi:MAG: hypothetical protein K2Y02_01950 [Burkholderiaceae bacterium]|nr:hypothetical protein [Burkholderiaceae bacterium]
MPYDPETGVAEGLLLILDGSVGRSRAGLLLHDHLDHPDDKATKLELVRACRAAITIERDVQGQAMKTRVGFETRIGGTKWDGDAIAIPTIPAAMAIAVEGRPLNTIIGHPLLPAAPIEGVVDDKNRRLKIVRRDVSMRTIRPGPIVRTLGGIRRALRRGRLARDLHAHTGLGPGVISLSLALGLLMYMLAGLVTVMAWKMSGGGDDFHMLPDMIGLATGVTTAIIATIGISRLTDKDDVVRRYVEDACTNLATARHPGTAEFDAKPS